MFKTNTDCHEAAEEAIFRQQTREELQRTVATANMLRDLLQQYERGIPSRSEAIDFLGSVDLLINAKSTTDPGDEEGAMFLLGDGLKCLFSEIIDWTMAEFSIPDSSEFCLSFQQPN